MNDNDETERIRFAKFQPVPEPDGFQFQKGEPTRLHVEFDGDAFEEIDARTGAVMARGVIERPEKDFGDRRREAA